MFFNYIKELLTKKIVKKNLSNVKLSSSDGLIKTVGIIFDETYFYEKDDLVKELVNEGILETNVEVLVFKNKIKKTETFDYPVFSYKDLSWNGKIEKPEVQQFVNEPFDLLINYYDTEKAALLLAIRAMPCPVLALHAGGNFTRWRFNASPPPAAARPRSAHSHAGGHAARG